MVPVAGKQVEALRLQVHQAQTQLSDAQDEIASLKAEVDRLHARLPAQPFVRSVSVTVSNINPVLALTLQKKIRVLLDGLVGLPVDQIDANLFRNLVDGRLVRADGRLYKVNLRMAILAPEVKLYLDAQEQTDG